MGRVNNKNLYLFDINRFFDCMYDADCIGE